MIKYSIFSASKKTRKINHAVKEFKSKQLIFFKYYYIECFIIMNNLIYFI